ncbi:hypothetical protein [Aeromonas salmonicida]|uniref:hypothetical protein n=1 Tax=Aeromonas salmonicida TaxID=645 RepID=UPI0039A5758A
MLKTCFDIVKYVIERRDRFKSESLNKDLVQLYHKIERCHSAYNELYNESEFKDINYLRYNHKECLDDLKKLVSKFVKYFEITGELELIGNLKVYVALESYESNRLYNKYDSINEHLEVIVNNGAAGDFERTCSLLRDYISENIDKSTLYKNLND